MSEGFIPIKRRLFNHFLFKEHRVFSRFEAWLDLIQMASFTDENAELINGKLISRDRGEVVASLRYLAQRWKWSVGRVTDYIELLRSRDMAVATKEGGMTKIKLVNYEEYNSGDVEKNSKADSNRYSKIRDGTAFDENEQTATGTPTDTASRQRADSERTNIKRINKEKKEKVSDGASAPSHTDEEEKMFSLFISWVEKHAPLVNKMAEPLTIKQFLKLRNDFPGDAGRSLIQEIILAMHNYKGLQKKYVSANLTLRSWINLRKRNGQLPTNEASNVSSINEKLKSAGQPPQS